MTTGRRRSPRRAALVLWVVCALLAGPIQVQRALAQATPEAGVPAACPADVTEAIDQEPNNLVTELQPIAGAVCLAAELTGGDQDLFIWTVSEDAAARRWTIELSGLPGQAGVVQLYRPEYASDGVSMTGATSLLGDNYQPGAGPATLADFLLEPGDYIVGVASSGAGPYRLLIGPGTDVPDNGDAEPNDDAEAATAVEAAFALAGDRNGSVDRYAWTLDAATAATHWRLAAQFRVGDAGGLRLFTLDGTPLYDSFAGTDGLLILEDVGLDAGTYLIEIPQTSPDSSPYILEATPGEPRAPDLENEPNDDAASAAPLPIAGPATTLTGRLATIGGQTIDTDTYRLTIDQSTAGRQLDLKVFWQGGSTRTVCLTDALEQRLRCADGDRGLAFNDLVFPAGDYLIEISGNPNPADPYLLRLDLTIEAIAGYETEPNDTQVTAGALDVRGEEPTAQGRLVGREEDYYRFTVAGEPQLWRAVVEGTGIERIAAVNAAGQTVASGNVDLATGTAQVSDLYLLPGDHWFSVIGTDGDYTIRLVPLGPPDPSYEREPNNTIDRSQPIRVGETRTGRLVEPYDQDLYRFALLAEEHVTIRVEPAADGIGRFRLAWGTVNVVALTGAGPGEPVVYEAVLPPGDYALTLEAQQPSEDLYQITIERNDPFILPDDAEPNDTVAQARRFPPDLIVSGAADPTNQSTDEDWYLLPPESEPTEVVVAFEPGEGINFGLTVRALASGETPETALTLTPRDAEDQGGTLTIPPGQPIAFGVRGRGEYRLAIERDGAGGFGGLSVPTILPVMLELTAPRAEIAAYWTDAQRVEAELTLTNSGDEALDLTLDALVSNELWDVTIETPTLTLAAGETATVPVSVRAGPDAWADYPVRVTVRARDAEGLAQTTALEIAVGRETPPLNPETGWALPPELLGGLNVAWAGLGGQPVQTDPTQFGRELALYDDLAASGVGWYGDAAQLATGPIELTVDLAGEEPVPVAGTALNPFGYQGVLAEHTRGFEVLVSDDGQTFEAVFAGELSALPVEQSFVFAEPVEARFVRLRLFSNQLGLTTGEIVLGEWKVIAQPGWSLPAEVAAGLPDAAPAVTPVPATEPAPAGAPIPEEAGLNIAAPSRGGHVVIIDPQYRDEKLTEELLVAGGAVEPLKIEPGGSAAWVIGFQHDRAAQVAALSWVDPEGLAPDALLFESVDVSVSLESPIGPWIPVGTWDVGSAADSSIFNLDQPVWARYVRFTTTVPPASADELNARPGDWHYPAQIAIFERPADEEYRSIVGEWGQDSRAAGYEIDNPPTPIVLDNDAANGADGATLLPLGDVHRDSAWVGRDEDWYQIEAPADAAFLEFALTGSPTLDVEVALFDEDGGEVALTISQASPREATYTAEVTPGATYLVRITEPPTSLVIAFDTSQSLLEQLPVIYQGLAGYAQDVVAGQEVVNFLPFGENMLLDEWGDDPYVLQLAITNYPRTAMSSDVEAAQIASIRDLEGRPGTQAILLITDAETSSYDQAAELWGVLGQTAPRIFAVNIGAGEDPWTQQDWMEAWAAVNSGVYSYVRSQGDLDVAFDRAATILRRPSIYGISVEATAPPPTPTPEPTSTPEPTATSEPTSTPAPTNTPQPTSTPVPTSTPAPTNTPIPEPTEPPTPTPEQKPGYLRVVAPAGGGQEGPVAIAGDVSVALIIDTSGSMLQPLESSTRADVAKGALIDLVTNTLPAGTNVSLRAFGTVPDSCESRLVVPQAPLDPAAMAATIQNLEVVNLVKTPLGASLAAVAEDLGTTPGPKLVVFVTDGEETCGGDPAAAIQALMDSGIDVRVNIVGFALDDEALKEQFEEWARLGNGLYFDAADAAELGEAIADAVAPLYNVIDEDGEIVATGQVGGASVRLPAGTYTVEVLTEPTRVYEGIVVPPGERVRLELAEETAADAIPLARAGTVATAAPPFSLGQPALVVSTGLLGLVGLYRGTSRLRDRQR